MHLATAAAVAAVLILAACDKNQESAPAQTATLRGDAPQEAMPPTKPAPAPVVAAPAETMPQGLLVAYAQFQVSPDGKVLPKPGPARLEMLHFKGGSWQVEAFEDPESNVFHKALVYTPPDEPPGLLTIGGTAATVKLWRRQDGKHVAQTLWSEDFGGKFSRMRDAELGDFYGDGNSAIAIGTHDQGVVAVLRPKGKGKYEVDRLHREKDTFAHEVEVGDLDQDGVLEFYVTLSEPNRFDTHQAGKVVRFVPKATDPKQRGPVVVANMTKRHAKEIYVGDVDGDGRDELYVAVEALTEGSDPNVRIVEPVEIRRFAHDTPADQGQVVASIEDRFCRFLTVGSPNGDGKKVMVAAAYRSGLWMLEPQSDPSAPWRVTSIDRNSSGFEHAALFADLDGDGRDELYVAADDQGELRRYTWKDGKVDRDVIQRREIPGAVMTWNLTAAPASLLTPEAAP